MTRADTRETAASARPAAGAGPCGVGAGECSCWAWPLPPQLRAAAGPRPGCRAMALRELKVCLLGDTGVGKSSIVWRFVEDSFDPNINPTIGSVP